MICVHHLNNSRSQRVLWLLEELALPYELVCYARHPTTMLAPAALKQVHPLGKSPVLTDGERVLAESGAILEYLVATYGNGRLAPALGTPDHLDYTYWLHYAEGSLMPLLLLKLIFDALEEGRATPWLMRPLTRSLGRRLKRLLVDRQLHDHLAYIEAHLQGRSWFAGAALTAADVQMSFPLEAALARTSAAHHPNIAAALARMQARPAYARALVRGTPYALAG